MRWRPDLKHPVVVGVVVLGAAGVLLAGFPIWKVAIAALVAYVILRIGLAAFVSLARPVPEPPTPGELRKVRIIYRCEICGAEVRMTVAPTEDPEAPKHCQDEMVLVTPLE